MRTSLRPSAGFTLLNLIIGFAMLSILLGAGVPGLGKLHNNHRADSAYNDLFTLMQFARMQAVSHRTQVLICPSKNHKDCIKDWSQPLMVYVDRDLDEKRDEDEVILREVEATSPDERLVFKVSGSQRYLRFKQNGGTGNQNGRLSYCLDSKGESMSRQIIIYRTGRVRKGKSTDAITACS